MMRCTTLLLVAGAVILAGTPSAASAQRARRRARSSVRIPVTKETTARVETVTVTRVDTVQVPGPTDTVTRTVTDTVTRIDTMMTPIVIPKEHPFYLGLAAGMDFPTPEFSASDKPGWHVEVPVGLNFGDSPVGIRVDVGYSSYSTHDWVNSAFGNVGNATKLNVDGDLKIAVPAVTPANVRVQPYFLGGFSWARFKNILEQNSDGTWAVPDGNSHSGAGWNVGMGADIGHFFVETRFARIKGVVGNISDVPVEVGIRF